MKKLVVVALVLVVSLLAVVSVASAERGDVGTILPTSTIKIAK